jgi:hypothetical protein
MGVQMGVQMTRFKEQSKNQMEGGWSKFKEQVIAPLATVARVGGGSGTTPPPPSSALSEAVADAEAAEAEAAEVVAESEDLFAHQEPISEKTLEDPTAIMTIMTPTMDIIEQEDDVVVGLEGDKIKNKTSCTIRESSEDSAAARNVVSSLSPAPSPSPSPSSPTDQQIHQDGGSKGNNNNARLSFKATVKKHLKVRPLFAICNNKTDEQEDNGSSSTSNNNNNNNGSNTASRDPTDTTSKDTRNKRRRRHWSFPALLSPSLLRTVSSAA